MKMTLDIDDKKVEEAMAEYGVDTKTEVIDLALRELLRKKAVERIMASMGKFPKMITNEELEALRTANIPVSIVPGVTSGLAMASRQPLAVALLAG